MGIVRAVEATIQKPGFREGREVKEARRQDGKTDVLVPRPFPKGRVGKGTDRWTDRQTDRQTGSFLPTVPR